MTPTGREESAHDELARAREELGAAQALLSAGYPRVALTRAYYAVFHACRALLYVEGYEPRSHHGVQHLFNLHFVKTGRFVPDTSMKLSRLQKYREDADYADVFLVDAESARGELEVARALVEAVAALLPSAQP